MVVTLPGGYVDQHGNVHNDAELLPLTGRDEEFLCTLPVGAPIAPVVTGLLGRCVRRLGSLPEFTEDVARNLLVGDREYLVMKLFEITSGSTLNILLRCPGEDCRQPMDVTLSLGEMTPESRAIASQYFRVRVPSQPEIEIEFRLPTGTDQEAMVGIVDESRAVSALLARCTGLDEAEIDALPASTRREIEDRMEELAPQVNIEINTTCPECGRRFTGETGWAAYCLGQMVGQSAVLEREIHLLAWHYHWSEADVLAMTRSKRRRYVALIEEELGHAAGA